MRMRSLVGDTAEIVGPETLIVDVARLMVDRDVSAVAIVDRSGMIGICTDRDLAAAVAREASSDTLVIDVMTESPDTVGPEVAVVDAATWMLETGYRHLPVVEDGELLGIVDIRDVLWVLVPKD
jgi:CBS domain-containing protein